MAELCEILGAIEKARGRRLFSLISEEVDEDARVSRRLEEGERARWERQQRALA